MGLLHFSFPGGVGTREGPPFVTEEFRFQQGLGYSGTVYHHKGLVAPLTPLMYGLGGELLSRSALAQDQDRDIGGGHLPDQREDLEHRFAGADEFLVLLGGVELPQKLSVHEGDQGEEAIGIQPFEPPP